MDLEDSDDDNFERLDTNLGDLNDFSVSDTHLSTRRLTEGNQKPIFGSQIRKSIQKRRKRSNRISNSFNNLNEEKSRFGRSKVSRKNSSESNFKSRNKTSIKRSRRSSRLDSRQSEYLIE